jgi:hypothetical protein
MRVLPLSVQELLANGQGINPIMVVGINFGNNPVQALYADKDLGDPLNPSIRGKILQFGQLEDVTRIDGSGSASSISFTLDDTDGLIKGIMDGVDITYNPVTIYQYFDGLSFNDLVPLFFGVLASPIEWDEGTRSVQLTAITRQSNYMVGFSLDESNVPVYHQSLLNKAWPMVFGSPFYTPTLLLQEIPVGYITNAFVVPDPSIPAQVIVLKNQILSIQGENPGIEPDQSGVFDSFGNTYSTFEDMEEFLPQYYAWANRQQDRIEAINLQIADLNDQYQQQLAKWLPRNNVIGGYRFPQGIPLICKVNERTFKITFLGGGGVPANPEEPCPASFVLYESPYQFTPLNQQPLSAQQQAADQATKSQQLAETLGLNNSAAQLQALIDSTPFEIPRAGAEFFEEGTQVELLDNLPGGYWHVASITPGILQGVYAYRTQNGYRRLAQVPPKYYSVVTFPMGPLLVTYVVLVRPLSTVSYFDNLVTTPYNIKILNLEQQENQLGVSKLTNKIEWEDEIFVNFISEIGPNVIDIMQWLIFGYTHYTIDAISFASVRAVVDPYPAAFCLTSRPIVDQLLQDLAYQSRCSLWLKNGVYFIKYLAGDPNVVSTITEDDIDFGSLRVAASSTDSIVTKYVATWRPDGVHEQSDVMLQNNVLKYGILEESHDYYIYNNYALVLKSATFWLLRKSNCWKMVTLKAHLTKLDIETLDDVNLHLADPYVTTFTDGVACQVESCQYNPNDNTIDMTLWTGIRFGEMLPYAFARPASLPANAISPLYTELNTGAAPSIPSEIFTPLTPFYNQLQTHTTIISDFDRNVDANGFVSGNFPSTLGDPFPSDQNDILTIPSYNIPDLVGGTPPVNDFKQFVVPPPLDVTANADILSKSFAGQVTSRGTDGTIWAVNMFPNGFGESAINKNAKELHGDTTLHGIEGEWVTVHRVIGQDGSRQYFFASAHFAAFPVLMHSKELGDVYPAGSFGGAVTGVTMNQLQLDDSADIPDNTWAICVRVWNMNQAYYQVQVPVWLPPV